VGFCIIWTLADKPNSVMDDHLSGPAITSGIKRHSPILPTEGGCRIERPEAFARDGSLTSFETLNFAAACGRQNWRTALHAGKDLFVAPPRLPWELALLRIKLRRAVFCFRKKPSLWSPLSLRTTGVTRYLSADSAHRQNWRMFGLSSLLRIKLRRAIA